MVWLAALLLGLAASVQAQDSRGPAAGAPGTATPQPFVVPTPRPLPGTAPHNLPLLDDGTGKRGGPLNPPALRPPPRDRPLPLLEQQRRRDAGDAD